MAQHGVFRSDIEGLRGIAVLSVVAYHAAPHAMPRGFLGVDIFFVISGYLITGLLWRELRTNGRLDLPEFWARRIRRIAPAAIVVLLAIAAATMLLPDMDGRRLGPNVIYAAISVFNWHQIAQKVDYLAQEDSANPVLHYWSLSVEEQFYLFWPLLLMALLYFSPRAILPAIFILVLASLGAAFYIAAVDPPLAFFGTGTRIWQLLTGAAMAIAPPLLGPRLRTALAIVGALFVLASLTVPAGAEYNQLLAVAVTVGTALILYAEAEPIRQALSLPPLTGAGRISYSLYLWHWPLLVLLPATLLGVSGAVTLAVAMSVASYLFIEQPARASAMLRRSHALTYSLGALLVVSAVGVGGALMKWGQNTQPVTYKDGCLLSREDVAYPDCAYGDLTSTRTVVLFGDSHAGNWFNALEGAAKRRGWRLLVRLKASCAPLDAPQKWQTKHDYPECAVWRRKVVEELRRNPPTLIFVSGAKSGDRDTEGRVLAALAATATTVAVRDTPRLPVSAPECVRSKDAAACSWSLESLTRPNRYPATRSQELPGGVSMLDLNAVVCAEGLCQARRDGRLTMFDNQHFTAAFSASMAPEFERLLRQHEWRGVAASEARR